MHFQKEVFLLGLSTLKKKIRGPKWCHLDQLPKLVLNTLLTVVSNFSRNIALTV